MTLKTFRPTTPARRQMTVIDYRKELTAGVKPEKSLIEKIPQSTGRNVHGHITSRRRGAGAHRNYRKVDFDRTGKLGIPAKVESIEYDPYRTAFIAKILYADGARSYIIAPHGMKKDDAVVCGEKTKIKTGNRLKLESIPTGTQLHCLQLFPERRGQLVRSAGTSATLVSLDGEYAGIRLPSGEVRKFDKNCFATIGVVSNIDNFNVTIGKAGRSRHRNRRPSVLGLSMNPVDHAHGGGEQHTTIGLKYPKTPTGRHALGKKTRSPKKFSNKWIISRRKKKK